MPCKVIFNMLGFIKDVVRSPSGFPRYSEVICFDLFLHGP